MSTDLAISGLASGFDWKSVVEQLVTVERSPQNSMRREQTRIQQKTGAYDIIQSQLSALQTKAKTLQDATLFDSRSTTSSSTAVATATASTSTPIGKYTFNISSLATSSILRSVGDMGGTLSATSNVSGVILASAGFSSAVTAGTFMVNGKQVTVATTDTLQQVFDNISAATGGSVTGSYDATSDKITLTHSSPSGKVVLGGANDTSNFLSVTRLNNNGSGSVTSALNLGAVRTSSTLNAANLATPVSDGGSHAGQLKVNGVSISYDASIDTINDVLKRITESTAGVSANYDPLTDGFVLTNKVSGNLGLAVEDVTGNFLAAAGLSGGSSSFEIGRDLNYTVNGNPTVLTSHSNAIDPVSSGLSGLSVNVLTTGSVDITIASDTSTIKQAIKDFVTEYNKSQSAIDTYTASTTDSRGKVTAGVLSGERDAFDITAKLRGLANGQSTGSSSIITFLSSLGIESNGNNNSLSIPDDAKLTAALSSNFSAAKDFFTNSTTGFAKQFYDYLNKTAGSDGDLTKKQTLMSQQISAIDDQIVIQERQVQNVKSALTAGFIAMEKAQAAFNQQQQFINQRFGLA